MRQEETDVGGWLLPRDPQVVPGAVLGGSNTGLARCTEPSSRQRTAAVLRLGGLHNFAAFHLLLISHEQRTGTQRFSLNGHRKCRLCQHLFHCCYKAAIGKKRSQTGGSHRQGRRLSCPRRGAQRSRCEGLPVGRPVGNSPLPVGERVRACQLSQRPRERFGDKTQLYSI